MTVTKEIQDLIARLRAVQHGAYNAYASSVAQEAADTLAALSAQPAVAVPDGWKLVPVEPTEAMLDAYWNATGESKEMRSRTHAYMRRYYAAMLAAAPVDGWHPQVDYREPFAAPQPSPQPVAVKPLEWDDGYAFCEPVSSGFYHVAYREGPKVWSVSGRGMPNSPEFNSYATEAEAKAAAQADYEQRILSALTTHPADLWEENEHPDDLAVDRFAAAMKAKLAKKREEGRGGWDDKQQCSAEFLSQLLREHVEKGDPLDVGNLAMMLHQRGEKIV